MFYVVHGGKSLPLQETSAGQRLSVAVSIGSDQQDKVDRVDKVGRVDKVDKVDKVDRVDKVDKVGEAIIGCGFPTGS